jgi:tetratricopeptide (TPR) repeat protein
MNNDRFVPKQFSSSDDQEDNGTRILQNLVIENDKVKFRLGGNDKTPNRDGFIELRNDQHVIGELQVQVKPVDSERKKQNRLCYQLHASIVGYSKVAGQPFILICYDRDTEKAYWKLVTETLFEGAKPEQQSRTIDLLPDDEIADGLLYTDKWLRISTEHLETKRMADTLRSAMRLLSADPDKPYSGQLDSPQSLADLLKRIEETAAEKYRARLQEAQKLFRGDEIEAAAKILSPLAEEISKEGQTAGVLFDVYIWLGNCHYRLEQPAEAETSFRDAMKLNDKSPKAQANLAHILYVKNAGKKEALTLAKAAYDTDAGNEYFVATYLLCLNFNQEQATIESLLKDRKAFVEQSSVVQLAVAQAAKEKHDYASACDTFRRVIEMDKSNIYARILLAESVYKLVRNAATDALAKDALPILDQFEKDLNEAVSELGSAIEYFSNTTDRAAHYRAYDTRAVINMIRGKLEPALADCEKMDAVIPNKDVAKIIRAQIYTQTDRFDDVITLLQPLAEGGRTDVLQALAYSYYRKNQFGDAAKHFTKYLDEDQASDSEMFAFAQSLWFSNDKKRAYQVAHKLRKTGRSPIVIMREIELARLVDPEIQDWAAALEVLNDLVKADPSNAEPRLQRVAMQMNLGGRDAALKLYQELPRDMIDRDSWACQELSKLEVGLRQLKWLR